MHASTRQALPPAWQKILMPHTSVSEAIQQIWQGSSPAFIPFYHILQQRIIDIAIVTTPSDAYIAYIFHNHNQFFAFLGGIPATPNEIAERESELGFSLPLHYQSFISVHNGFLLDGWDSVGIRRLRQLYKMEVLFKDNPHPHPFYKPNSLIGFCGEGDGNEQCFHYDDLGIVSETVFWDHETRSIGKPLPFEVFLVEFLRRTNG